MKSEPSPTERMNPSSTRISGIPLSSAAPASPAGAREAHTAMLLPGLRRAAAMAAFLVRRKTGVPALDRRKCSDLPTLPERHSEANRDVPVDGFDFLPLCEDLQNLLERCGFPPVWVEIAGREEASACKDFVNRPAERSSRYTGLVRRNAPARIERIGKAADFGSGQQREKTGLASGRVDRFSSGDRFPNVHRSGQDGAPARGGVFEKAGRQTTTACIARNRKHDLLRRGFRAGRDEHGVEQL